MSEIALKYFPYYLREPSTKIMLFIDGENFAIRYKQVLNGAAPLDHVTFEPDIYIWSSHLTLICACAQVVRKYYYTSVRGAQERIDEIVDSLKELGIEAPRVFKRTKNRGSKRVDITLSADMLTHASSGNYDVAVLIAGDEDYVPLVEAVQRQGCRVHLWFFTSGLSPVLKRICDDFQDLAEVLFEPDHKKIID